MVIWKAYLLACKKFGHLVKDIKQHRNFDIESPAKNALQPRLRAVVEADDDLYLDLARLGYLFVDQGIIVTITSLLPNLCRLRLCFTRLRLPSCQFQIKPFKRSISFQCRWLATSTTRSPSRSLIFLHSSARTRDRITSAHGPARDQYCQECRSGEATRHSDARAHIYRSQGFGQKHESLSGCGKDVNTSSAQPYYHVSDNGCRFIYSPPAKVEKKLSSETEELKSDIANLNKKLHYLETTHKNSREHIEKIIQSGGRS